MGDEGDRRLDRRPGDPAQRGDRRHDPGLADARARRAAANDEVEIAQQVLQSMGLRSFLPQVSRLPRLRPDDLDVLPGDGPARSRRYLQGPDAGLAGDPPGRRGDAGRGHGLRRQRPGRSRSTPTSGSACRARSRTRSRRCSSTASWTGRCAATASSRSSSAILDDYVDAPLPGRRGGSADAPDWPVAIDAGTSPSGVRRHVVDGSSRIGLRRRQDAVDRIRRSCRPVGMIGRPKLSSDGPSTRAPLAPRRPGRAVHPSVYTSGN